MLTSIPNYAILKDNAMRIDSSFSALNAPYLNHAAFDKPINYIDKTTDDTKLKEQTDAFEALILKFMLDTALKFDNPLYPKEAGSVIYESMYKDSIADALSGGFGYSELLYNYLKDLQK